MADTDYRLINKQVLAEKHNVSKAYVRMVLSGDRASKSKKAQAIKNDADAILNAFKS